jgi:hypothetical protein
MTGGRYEGVKFFTVDEANACLPLVRAITRDWARLSRDVVEGRERLAHLLSHRPKEGHDFYRDELAQVEQELEKDALALQEYVHELRELGVEPKNGLEGLVDFPALMEGRPVYLCWKLDEPEVLFWHEIDAGFRGRQPLTADSISSASDLDTGGASLGD